MKFKNLIRDLILEDARLDHLLKTHAHKDIVKVNQETGKKKVKKAPLTAEEMMMIVGNDPTSVIDGIEQTQTYDEETLKAISPDSVKKTGEYSQWIIKQFKKLPQTLETPYTERDAFVAEYNEKKRLFFEDLYSVKEDLIKFHRFKSSDKIEEADINKYTIDQLSSTVSGLSLEMATTTAAERKSSMLHPGAEFVFEDDKWYVVTMRRDDELGKEAAVFYGGSNKRPDMGETSWCTSAPGMNYYFTYLRQGPYYVIIDKTDSNKGKISGLPAHRYQFHFESNQFMDVNDRQIDFVKFFNDNPNLKDGFKDVINNHFKMDEKTKTNEIEIKYPNDGISKLIALFGFGEFFSKLPADITSFEFEYESNRGYGRNNNLEKPQIDIPSDIVKFKNLSHIYLSGVVKSLPENIGDMENLKILGVPDNQGLKLPESVAKLIDNGLRVLLIADTGLTRETLPQPIQDAIKRREENMLEDPTNPFILVERQ